MQTWICSMCFRVWCALLSGVFLVFPPNYFSIFRGFVVCFPCLLCPFPILNLFFILSSYMLLASGTPPLLIPIYTITLPWQFLLAPRNVFSPSESCILHHYFLCQFSQSHWSLLLVIIRVLLSLSSTRTLALGRSFFGCVFHLNLLPVFFQLQPI